jgi:son of sevenless-like protein
MGAAAAAAAAGAGRGVPTGVTKSRFATVRLRGTPQLVEVGSPTDVTNEYMSMMKWTAEFVPNLTRSLFQDPGISKTYTPAPDFIPPPSLPPPPVSAAQEGRYYIFAEPDTPQNMRINPTTGELVAATLPKVIAKLTDKDMPGKEFIQAFLMTYRSFAEPTIVLDLLSSRFDVPESQPDSMQETIQIRVWFFLKEWISSLIDDFVESNDLAVRMTNLIERMCGSPRDSVAQASAQLRQLFHQKLSGAATAVTPVPPFGAPKPVAPSGPIDSILDIAPIEIARQLTLMRFEVFKQIKPKELCDLAWTKKDALRRAPNVV